MLNEKQLTQLTKSFDSFESLVLKMFYEMFDKTDVTYDFTQSKINKEDLVTASVWDLSFYELKTVKITKINVDSDKSISLITSTGEEFSDEDFDTETLYKLILSFHDAFK